MNELLAVVASAGGGGSGGGGGGGGGILAIPIIIICFIVAWWLRRERIKKAEADHRVAVASDPSWSHDLIGPRATEVFYKFQQDWSNFKLKEMAAYLTPRYHKHIGLMLGALKQMKRRNAMSNVKLKSATLFGVHDTENDELDMFNVEMKASVKDQLIDESSGKPIHSNPSSIEEIWHFEREGKTWKLDSIGQINNDGMIPKYDPIIDGKYSTFAEQNDFFYNADFGWMLMPLHGVLFSDASYGRSDINHHVIGLYHDIIVQFYQYIPLIETKATLRDKIRNVGHPRKKLATYTVAHATLPKDYKNILLERRPLFSFFSFAPSSLQKISLEWPEFNQLFNVYADDIDKVNSLELLHPVYMEKLASTSFRVNMEIVGRDLYLYTTAPEADYQQMLQLLRDAFVEMQM